MWRQVCAYGVSQSCMWAMLAGASLLALVLRKERTLFVVLLQELGAGGEASPGDDALRDALQAPALARSFVIVAHPVGGPPGLCVKLFVHVFVIDSPREIGFGKKLATAGLFLCIVL